MSDLLRLYDPNDLGADGYPHQWHLPHFVGDERVTAVKDYVRAQEGHRCERCRHPYPLGIAETHPRGEWTPCDEECHHDGPVRIWTSEGAGTRESPLVVHDEAQWRILTVHHLNGVKYDCRWWNLAALCQRCHLSIQSRVVMERVFPFEHTDWFKPHAAGWYASIYLGEDLTRAEVDARMDELLALERMA